jgi:tetratricopeptide (TPR) repeat protein
MEYQTASDYNVQNNMQSQTNFLEVSVINEIIQNYEQIESKCKGQCGEEIVNERIKQVAYAKILCNVYNKDITYLIKAYAQLGIAYLDIEFYEQAQEHLLNAFKLNENLSDEDNLNMKEYQIKILINLSKCYLENDKLEAALQISQRSLKMNQTLFGESHVSNADIYYVLAKINTKLKKYKEAIENLRCMFETYEKIYGFDSEKTAKICMEIGQIYELWNNLNDAIEYYNNSYKIWEKIIEDDNYEVLYSLVIKLSELYAKIDKGDESYKILSMVDEKYGDKVNRSIKDRVVFQRCKIKACSYIKDMDLYLKENLKLEEILNETSENQKTLAKTCISIGYIYLENGNKDKCLEYLNKAKKIFTVNGDMKLANEIQGRIYKIQKNEETENNNEENNNDFEQEQDME